MGVTQCLELSTGNMQCVAMILLAGASLSHSSTDVKVSAHDPKSGLPYSYSITTVDTVPSPANMYSYHGLGYASYPNAGYAGYPNTGYAGYTNAGYAGYPN